MQYDGLLDKEEKEQASQKEKMYAYRNAMKTQKPMMRLSKRRNT